MASSSHLKPDEKGQITVSVNTSGKFGKLSKSVKVYSNDPDNPVYILYVTMYVKDSIHIKEYSPVEIFSEGCRSCHVERGKGKKGIALFRADCIMCHRTGKSASSLTEMRKQSSDYIIYAIKAGVDNSSMPGFDIKNGGPLSEDEIESLVSFILRRKKVN